MSSFKIIFYLLLFSFSSQAKVISLGGGGIISGEPVVFDIYRVCDLSTNDPLDPTFSDVGTIEFGYESAIDSYTVILNTLNQKLYYPSKKLEFLNREQYRLYVDANYDEYKLAAIINLRYGKDGDILTNNVLTSYSNNLRSYDITNCIQSASIEW